MAIENLIAPLVVAGLLVSCGETSGDGAGPPIDASCGPEASAFDASGGVLEASTSDAGEGISDAGVRDAEPAIDSGPTEPAPPHLSLCQTDPPHPRSADPEAPPDRLDGPPVLLARSWTIADAETGELLFGCNVDEIRGIASTTKIMTAFIVLELALAEPTVLDETFIVTARADTTGGTTANLVEGETISVRDALYGMLLPSGNDAAVALAESFGSRFEPREGTTTDDPVLRFTAEMNRRAVALGMGSTHYDEPHGSSDNASTPRDLVRLAHVAMENELFRDYVQTRTHDPVSGSSASGWDNTNTLLGIEGFDGIKTGITGRSGGCLVARGHYEDQHLFVVVLGSTKEGRILDVRNLFRWAITIPAP